MGANSSTAITNDMSNIVDTAMSSINTTISNSSSNIGTSSQIINITNGKDGIINCPNFNVSQNTNISISSIQKATDTITSKSDSSVEEAVKNAIKTEQKQSNALSLLDANSSNAITNITNTLTTAIKSEINNVAKTVLANFSGSGQEMNFYNDGTIEGNMCNFSQNSVINMISKQVTKAVIDSDAVQSLITNLENDVSTKTDQSNSLFGNMSEYIIIALIVMAAIAGLYMFSGGKITSNSTSPRSQYILYFSIFLIIVLIILGILYHYGYL